MNRLMKTACVMGLLIPMLGCTATASPGGSSAPGGEELKVGLSMDALDSGFWIATEEAIQAEVKEQGVVLTSMMAEGDPNKQNQHCDNLIAQGVKALIIAPKDGDAIQACVKKAKDAGVYVVMMNRPVQGDTLPDVQVLSDNYTMAKEELQWFADRARNNGEKYKTLLLIGNLGDENAVERKNGYLEAAEANTDVIEIVAQVPTEWKHEVTLAGMQNALAAYPDINLVITPSDFLWPPIQTALTQVGRWATIGEPNHMAVLSFDGDETGMQMLKDGYSWANAAQAADVQGKLSVQWAVKLIKGEKPEQVNLMDPGILATVDNCTEVCPKVWSWKA